MKKKNTIPIALEDWEVNSFKARIKTQMTFLCDPQPLNVGYVVASDMRSPSGFTYYPFTTGQDQDGGIQVKNPLGAKVGDILYCKEHHLHLKVVKATVMYGIDDFTDQDALNEGIGAIYPGSGFGGEGFYLPDEIIEQTALACFKFRWDSLHPDWPFEKNPYVITFALKIVKL